MRPTKGQQAVLSAARAALGDSRPVTVDGVAIRDISFRDGEIEVEWAGCDEEFRTIIQPNFLNQEGGIVTIKTD